MSASKRSRSGRNVVKPLVVAVALSLPGAAALAEDMSQVVTTRADQNIHQQYGRDSVYAFSRDAKPYMPEQSESRRAANDQSNEERHTGWLSNAWDSTKSYAANTWHRTEDLFRHGAADATAGRTPQEPQRYGRAGGYVGSDRVAMIGKSATMAPESIEVKTGAAQDNTAGAGVEDKTSQPSAGMSQPETAAAQDTSTELTPLPLPEQNAPLTERSPAPREPDDTAAAAPNDSARSQGVMDDKDVVRSPDTASDNGRVDSDDALRARDEVSSKTR